MLKEQRVRLGLALLAVAVVLTALSLRPSPSTEPAESAPPESKVVVSEEAPQKPSAESPVEDSEEALPQSEEALPEVLQPHVEMSWRRILLDAGHGGEDSGARGVSGALEKEVTLGISRACARELRGLGFEVIETRTEDRAVQLERRSALANAKGAGVFISIHANSAGRDGVRGVETYYMDLASDEAASRLAERENRARSVAGDPRQGSVETMIADLKMGAYAKQSRALARGVHQQLVSGLREFYGTERVVDRGVRTAPFWVLLDSQMPAVLLEVGYLTNSGEERRMRTNGFQRHAARAIATAVAEFVEQAEAAEPLKTSESKASP
jgi:N-acetylmuramoyl-L-alanine amidase